MRPSDVRPRTSRGYHRILRLAKVLRRGLWAQAGLAFACLALAPFGAERQRGFEEFVTIYDGARALTMIAFVVCLVLWVGWAVRVRANLPALSGHAPDPIRYWPLLPELFWWGPVQKATFELAEAIEVSEQAERRVLGPHRKPSGNGCLVGLWMLGVLVLFVGAGLEGVLRKDEAPLLLQGPPWLLYGLWCAGALLTAHVVGRVTDQQMLAIPNLEVRPPD